MDYEILRLEAGAPELEPDSDLCRFWDSLIPEGQHGDPFCCGCDWNVPFHRMFTPEQPVVMVRSDTSLLAFTMHPLHSSLTVFHSLESGWLYANPLLGSDSVELLAEAMPDLADLCGTTLYFLVSALRPGMGQAHRILQVFGRSMRIFRRDEDLVTVGASLEGGIDGWLSRRSANHRAKLRKARRRARRRGITFERHVPRSRDEAAAIYRRMVAVEDASWKGLGHCGMTEEPYCSFYGDMIGRLAVTGRARVILARCDGRDIGFVFGGMLGGYYRGQQFSYDADWHDWSIGNLLQLEQVEWLCEEGALRYDMGAITGPRMGYKEHWTEFEAQLESWFLLPGPAIRSRARARRQ